MLKRYTENVRKRIAEMERHSSALLAPTMASTPLEHEAHDELRRQHAEQATVQANTPRERFASALTNAQRCKNSTSEKVRDEAFQRLVRRGTALLAQYDEVRERERAQADEIAHLSAAVTAIQDDLLKRVPELEHARNPLLAENVFVFGEDAIPSAAKRFPTLEMPNHSTPTAPTYASDMQSALRNPISSPLLVAATSTFAAALLPQVVVSSAKRRATATGRASGATFSGDAPRVEKAAPRPRKRRAAKTTTTLPRVVVTSIDEA